MSPKTSFKPNVLAIVPPYMIWGPPAGAAALLAYLKASGCQEFSFIDLRLFTPSLTNPTYRVVGAFGESFVLDVPDLPLVLSLLDRFRCGEDILNLPDDVIEPYCIERGLNSLYLREYIRRIGQLSQSIFSQIPDMEFVGFSVWTSNYLTTLLTAALLKRRARPPFIVAGGPQVSQSTASAQLGLRAGVFDAVVTGEGEQTLVELFGHYSHNHQASKVAVPGTMTYEPGTGAFQTTERSLLFLKDLPLPDFDEMLLPAYELQRQRVATYQLSRGCTDKCSFCSEWVFWKHFRTSSMDKAVTDVSELQRRWGAQRIWFTDSLLNGHMNKLQSFAEGLLKSGIKINWNGFMRAQIDLTTAQLLRRAGCIAVFIGVESLSNETLDLMNKRMTEFQNLTAIKAFLEAGIHVTAGLIPGFPGDMRDRFLRTAQLLRQMQAVYSRLSVSHEPFVVLPGQPIYKSLDKYGLTPIPWSDDVLAIAPELSQIARGIWCRIEGPNQGFDRIGEYRVSLSLTGSGQPADDELDGLRESITLYDVTILQISQDVCLGRTLSPRGHLIGVILTEDEHQWFTANRDPELQPLPVCERQALAAKLEAIMAAHVASVSLSMPCSKPMKYRKVEPPATVSAELALGALTIARHINGTLWLANLATARVACLPSNDETAVAILNGTPLPLRKSALELVELGLLAYVEIPPDMSADFTDEESVARVG
jgi:radical SAM superfamily enzyme YgiQ (UPF0313 family)